VRVASESYSYLHTVFAAISTTNPCRISTTHATMLGGIRRVAILDLYCIAITRDYLSFMYCIDSILKWLYSLR
jgi:hypothetical protein